MFFERFTETEIGKSSSELEKKVEALKELQKKYPDDERIKRDLRTAEFGLKGEQQIEYELKNANLGMYVLHDINLKYEDLNAQIDFVVITKAAIYFIESKNLFGNITVDNNGNFTRECIYDGKKLKEAIYSPYAQAERHRDVMKKIWLASHNKVVTSILNKSFDDWYRSLVVIANPKSVLNVKYAPKEIKDRIIKLDSLVRYLKKDISRTSKINLSTKKEIYDSGANMLSLHQDINIDYEKIYGKKSEQDKEQIKNELVEFRKVRAKERSIPAYYVFTDAELEEIIEKMPTTIEELSDILVKIKILCHGEDIIKIINRV